MNKTAFLIAALLASAGAIADDYATRQYRQDHLNELRRQTRAIEDSRFPAEKLGPGLTRDGMGNLHFSRAASAADTLNDLARKLERRAQPQCIVVNGRVFCEGN